MTIRRFSQSFRIVLLLLICCTLSAQSDSAMLFNQAFSYFNMGYAASMAVALFALVMGASLILIKVRRTTTW